MAMGSFNGTGSQMPTAEINMTPLVDVMLVLLIIFMITAPLMTHSVKVDLPRASSTPTPEKPMTLQVAITADNKVFVGSEPVDAATLETRFRDAVGQDANVELHLKADRDSRYESVAETMSTARRAGIGKIGFVTQPGDSH
ncbi:outer membrane transport energization protein ExbD [Azonexus fungiphilus]|jgi:biopolymer transport protein ExbD|uniref:Outer membrane transport energization protein ExbD n=1 Tax=Azonexus fungiphilus TaxID=146940 RepID=A0A495WDI0_9RHOO|nr:biopolymer transporter ExbD [Azonexus fungiphilus]NHC05885.1 biopolymer transporter ExbD [Azonexus fungiphilus]RKT59267.1 outer membrane transport energization protein ExbD [Azonexus fungiphilus]